MSLQQTSLRQAVVLFVRDDMADVHMLHVVSHRYDEAVLVAANVEDRNVLTQEVCCTEVVPDLMRTLQVTLSTHMQPNWEQRDEAPVPSVPGLRLTQ